MVGLRTLSGHLYPPDSCGDLLPAPLQAQSNPHAELLWYTTNSIGSGHPGVGLAPEVVVVQQLPEE